MIGGRVKETLILSDRVWVNARDTTYMDECAIYVERSAVSERIQPCDLIWWQGREAMWTPAHAADSSQGKQGVDWDIVIPRIGYSGALHPAQRMLEADD